MADWKLRAVETCIREARRDLESADRGSERWKAAMARLDEALVYCKELRETK